jgi:hypothetical protein
MENFIFRMEINEIFLPKKLNRLGTIKDSYDYDDIVENRYELYFPTFEEMSIKIDEITEGFHQFWADVRTDMYDNNIEDLEYHNGVGEWNKELHIETSRLYLIESLLKSIELNNTILEIDIQPIFDDSTWTVTVTIQGSENSYCYDKYFNSQPTEFMIKELWKSDRKKWIKVSN